MFTAFLASAAIVAGAIILSLALFVLLIRFVR